MSVGLGGTSQVATHNSRQGTPIRATYGICGLQMLEASRNASNFADTIEYAIFVFQVLQESRLIAFCSQ